MIAVSGSSRLIIIGQDTLDFNKINEGVLLSPSRIIKKGEVRSKTFGEARRDVWVYEIETAEDGEPDTTLEKLLKDIKPFKEYIQKLSESTDICVRYFVQSDLKQINWKFSYKTINELADLNIKLEISILSWGGVEIED